MLNERFSENDSVTC